MNFDNPDVCFVRSKNQISCEIDGEIAILNLNSKLYFGLTGSAVAIWEMIANPLTFDQIVTALMEIYAVEREMIEDDVRIFLGRIADSGLLETR